VDKKTLTLDQQVFKKFFYSITEETIQNELIVHQLSEQTRLAFGFESSAVYLSGHTIISHREKHRDIDSDIYFSVGTMLENGRIFIEKTNRVIVVYFRNQPYRISVKQTQDKKKIYLLSIFKTNETRLDSQIFSKYREVVRTSQNGLEKGQSGRRPD